MESEDIESVLSEAARLSRVGELKETAKRVNLTFSPDMETLRGGLVTMYALWHDALDGKIPVDCREEAEQMFDTACGTVNAHLNYVYPELFQEHP
jgi:hypothetical protein